MLFRNLIILFLFAITISAQVRLSELTKASEGYTQDIYLVSQKLSGVDSSRSITLELLTNKQRDSLGVVVVNETYRTINDLKWEPILYTADSGKTYTPLRPLTDTTTYFLRWVNGEIQIAQKIKVDTAEIALNYTQDTTRIAYLEKNNIFTGTNTFVTANATTFNTTSNYQYNGTDLNFTDYDAFTTLQRVWGYDGTKYTLGNPPWVGTATGNLDMNSNSINNVNNINATSATITTINGTTANYTNVNATTIDADTYGATDGVSQSMSLTKNALSFTVGAVGTATLGQFQDDGGNLALSTASFNSTEYYLGTTSLKLSTTPGNSVFYGTNGTGTLGYYAESDPVYTTASTNIAFVNNTNTFQAQNTFLVSVDFRGNIANSTGDLSLADNVSMGGYLDMVSNNIDNVNSLSASSIDSDTYGATDGVSETMNLDKNTLDFTIGSVGTATLGTFQDDLGNLNFSSGAFNATHDFYHNGTRLNFVNNQTGTPTKFWGYNGSAYGLFDPVSGWNGTATSDLSMGVYKITFSGGSQLLENSDFRILADGDVFRVRNEANTLSLLRATTTFTETNGYVNAKGGYYDNGTSGIDATYSDGNGGSMTVSGGIITAKTDGQKYYSGVYTGAPSNAIGNNGDIAYDQDLGGKYVKINGSWVSF